MISYFKRRALRQLARFLPPLVITEELVDKGKIFADAVKEVEKEF